MCTLYHNTQENNIDELLAGTFTSQPESLTRHDYTYRAYYYLYHGCHIGTVQRYVSLVHEPIPIPQVPIHVLCLVFHGERHPFSSAFVSSSLAKLSQEFPTIDPALYSLHFGSRLKVELDTHQPECEYW